MTLVTEEDVASKPERLPSENKTRRLSQQSQSGQLLLKQASGQLLDYCTIWCGGPPLVRCSARAAAGWRARCIVLRSAKVKNYFAYLFTISSYFTRSNTAASGCTTPETAHTVKARLRVGVWAAGRPLSRSSPPLMVRAAARAALLAPRSTAVLNDER